MSWQSQTLALLSASLVRPFALACMAWLLLRLLKVRHPASRHAVWTMALIGMIALPIISVVAPHWKLPLLSAPAKTLPHSSISSPSAAIVESSDFAPQASAPTAPPAKAPAFTWPATPTLVIWCYLAGFIAMLLYRLTGWIFLRRVLFRSKPVRSHMRESADVLTPVAVGVLRPSVILPAGWRNWNAHTKRAVLAHEFAHLRRRDTLISAISRLAKCLFWFHPLAWWISRQISDLAELSCDAAALEKTADPAGYSRILLSFADAVNRAGRRAALPGLAIATSAGMSNRIDQIFEFAGGNMRKLSRPGMLLAMTGIPIMCLAATVGLTTTPAIRAKTSLPSHANAAPVVIPTEPPPAPVEMTQAQTPPPPAPKPAPVSKPKFDVASIKPCTPGTPVMGRGGAGVAGAPSSNGTGGYFAETPGRFSVSCGSVMTMVNVAYIGIFGTRDPLINDSGGPMNTQQRIKGVPAWAMDARYTIEATTDDPIANGPTDPNTPAWNLMEGPMLQSLLEDRFQLKIHRDTEEVPMYALTVAKGGIKLKPAQPGDCTPPEAGPGGRGTIIRPIGLNDKPYCHWMGGPSNGPNRSVMGGDVTLSRLADFLGTFALDRHVIDRTGIAGEFNIRLEYAPDDSTPCVGPAARCAVDTTSDIPLGSSIFSAIEQQLGLKIEPIKAPHGYIVIDHVEKPSEN